MNLGKTVLFICLLFIFLGGGILFYNSIILENAPLSDLVKSHLDFVSQSKSEMINHFILNVREDINYLAESEEVKSLLEKEITSNDFVAKRDVDLKIQNLAMEVENYIKFHPEMTLKELQESEEFKVIAVQEIGETGYSGIIEIENLSVVVYNKKEFYNFNLTSLNQSNKLLFEIINKIHLGAENSSGFYNWVEADGKISRKYINLIKLPVKTIEGVSLIFWVNSYVDYYRVIKEVDSQTDTNLKNFEKIFEYNNLILISPDGYLIYMAENSEEQTMRLGENLEWVSNLKTGLSKNYFLAKENNKFSFFGPFVWGQGENTLKFSVISPVYEKEVLLGYVGLIEDMSKINKISEEPIGLEEYGKTYLINDGKLLITGISNSLFEPLIQSISTKNAEDCFGLESNSIERVQLFLDYEDNEFFGAHREIFGVNWCLLSEVNKKELFESSKEEKIKKELILLIFLLFIFILVSVYFKKYLDKNFVLVKKKINKYPCGFQGITRPLHCRIFGIKCINYSKGGCKKILNYPQILKNLKLKYSFLIALVFSFVYFLFIGFFLHGFRNPIFCNELPDLFTIIILVMIFFYGFKLKNLRARRYVYLGSSIVVFGKILQIFLEKYLFEFREILFYWVFGSIISFLGILSLLEGFKEDLK